MRTIDEAARLGEVFRGLVRRQLTRVELEAVDRLNLCHGGYGCSTHDFCDANVLMADAFDHVMGREADPGDQGDVDLINRAWELAKRAGYSPD